MMVLVTGASGFLGLNYLQYVVDSRPSAEVVAADLCKPDAAEWNLVGHAGQQIRFAALDVCDRRACFGIMRRIRPTHILHAAAVTIDNAECTTKVNLQGTANVLDAAVAAGSVERCIVLSSSSVYSQGESNATCGEGDALDLRGVYARTKREAEMLMPVCEAAGGFPVAAARVGPVYGPFERERATRPRMSLIGRLLEYYRSGHTVFVAGSDMHRDWTHAADVAAALNGLMFAPALNHRVYNVSAGIAYSAREVVKLFDEAGLVVRWVDADQPSDLVLDPADGRKPLSIARLGADTEFMPRFDLKTGLAKLIASVPAKWERER